MGLYVTNQTFMNKTVPAQVLRAQVATVLIAAGSTAQEAETVAANLVMANLSGHDSHGVGMLPRYVDAVLEGGLTPNNGARVVLDIGTMLTLDGQRGYGQIVGELAMAMAIDRAKTHGSCIMTLANSHHLGRIGHFAEMGASAPTPVVSVFRSKVPIHLCWTLRPAAWRREKCAWRTTRGFKSSPVP
jgi:hydroxycarboxylate dehydrogenase B